MAPEDSLDPGECRACRGGGKVVSMLGEERQEVDCPWCDGTGRYIPEHDAQARWTADGAPKPETGPETGETAGESSLDA